MLVLIGAGLILISFIFFMIYEHLEQKRRDKTLEYLLFISNPQNMYLPKKGVE